MKAHDFFYDGIKLSDLGMVICHFDSLGVETISMGSEITFNTVSAQHGTKHELTSSTYEDCLTFTLQICNNLCNDKSEIIDLEKARDIMRWLNRREYNKFKLIDSDGEYTNIFFNASFNVSKIEVNGKIVGFELEGFTSSPFALHEPITVNINNEIAGGIKSLYNKSDEFDFIYPRMEIAIEEAGDLSITNSIEPNRVMLIKNCELGEVITVDYPLISSSSEKHKDTIMNDYNWRFLRLGSTFKNRLNEITMSLPCQIKLTYTPVVKVGV